MAALFLFVILFGLSMDYHVLILSRVREAFDRGMNTEQAVSSGIKATAGVVTSAAMVMVAVFAIFATLSGLDFKMMGVGLAAAVLIDATIVRAVLLPASMKLLGDANWYLPRWLEWLPRSPRGRGPGRGRRATPGSVSVECGRRTRLVRHRRARHEQRVRSAARLPSGSGDPPARDRLRGCRSWTRRAWRAVRRQPARREHSRTS